MDQTWEGASLLGNEAVVCERAHKLDALRLLFEARRPKFERSQESKRLDSRLETRFAKRSTLDGQFEAREIR